MKKQNGFNALVYLFDHIIAEKLGYSYTEYVGIMDSMTESDSVFVLESVFEYIAIEDEGGKITEDVMTDFNEAVNMFNEHAEVIKKDL